MIKASIHGKIVLAYDAGLLDLDLLLGGLEGDVLAVPVHTQDDALAVVDAALKATGSRRLMVLCHGRAGELMLGAEVIDQSALERRAALVASWGVQSIDLYACHVGADKAFVQALEQLSGAVVAASNRVVGHASVGGSWELQGVANSVVPFSRSAQDAWSLALGVDLAFNPGVDPSNPPLTGWDENNKLIPNGSISVAEANFLLDLSPGVTLKASIYPADTAANLAALAGTGRVTFVHVFITGSVAAADLSLIRLATIGTINGSALTDINGTAAAVLQALTALDTDPTNFNTLLSAGAAAAADITAIETANGTGTIGGSALTDINGTAAAVVQALTDLDTDPTNFNSALTGVAAAADITAIATANGTGTIDGSALTAINGTAAAVAQALTDLDTDPTNFNSALTGVAAAADIAAIATANGTGTIDGSALTAINGTALEIITAYSLGISGLGNKALSVTNSSISVETANAIAANTSGIVTATISELEVTTLLMLEDDQVNAYTIKAESITVDQANDLLELTFGEVSCNIEIRDTTGNAADLVATLSGPEGNRLKIVHLYIVGSAAAADLNTIRSKFGTNIAGYIEPTSALTDINGTVVEVLEVFTTGGGGRNFGDVATTANVTVNDTAGVVLEASALRTLGGNTSGVVTVSKAVVISGSAAEVTAALVNPDTLVVATTANVTVTDPIGVDAVNDIAAETDGVVTATISDEDVTTLLTLTDDQVNDYTITIKDGTATAADLNTIDGKTFVVVDATAVGTISGSLAELLAATDDQSTLDTAANVVLTVTDADTETLLATDLSTLGGRTTGTVTVSNAVTISGSPSEVTAALVTADTLVVAAAAKVSISGNTSVGEANAIAVKTAGVVTATISEEDVTTLLTLTYSHVNDYTITIDDTTGAAAALNTLDGLTLGVINAG
ncbi:DUF4347 domain-containing protein, partial [Cyanobium sp. BA20m-14]|uniref:DUF4347 domain-containing protein n=1 Tax=Cyanobium sp. BA20m-14 TaxID=2823703 RepID=UPI0020CFC905